MYTKISLIIFQSCTDMGTSWSSLQLAIICVDNQTGHISPSNIINLHQVVSQHSSTIIESLYWLKKKILNMTVTGQGFQFFGRTLSEDNY